MVFRRIINLFSLFKAIGGYEQFIIEKAHIEELLSCDPDVTPSPILLFPDKYQVFLNDLKANALPNWCKRGTLPRPLLRPLLECLTLYFNEDIGSETGKFRRELMAWIASLSEYVTEPISSPDDIYCLLGQVIQVQDKSLYLVELLLDFLENDKTSFNDKMVGLACWLADYDASYIVNSPALQATYATMNVGSSFSISCLCNNLKSLPVTSPTVAAGIADLLLILARPKVTIDREIMEILREIYRLRWVQIQKNSLVGYLGCQQGDNAHWIRLAQLICGAGWLSRLYDKLRHKGNKEHFTQNYYRLLMPTINCDTEPVQLVGIADHAFGHLILSHSGDYLILVDSCVSQFFKSAKFYNWNTYQPRPLTSKEIEGLKLSYFHAYTSAALEAANAEDLPVSKFTIMRIKALVEESFYTNGLYDNYTKSQLEKAEKAVYEFYNFLSSLPSDERDRLLAQRIILGKKNKTVGEIFYHVDNDGSEACIAGCCELLIQLLLDYAPLESLNSELGDWVDLYKMRENSRKKVYSEYNELTTDEAARRILILAVSIMSSFQSSFLTGVHVSLFGSSVRLQSGGLPEKIFNLIKPIIEHNNFGDARHVYATIISLVKPERISSKSFFTAWAWFGSSSLYQPWLVSVANESLFEEPYRWVQPAFVVGRLLPVVSEKGPLCYLIEPWLDSLLEIYASNQNNLSKEVQVNIKFAELLNSMEAFDRQQLLELLDPVIPQREINPNIFLKYMIHRLAVIGAKRWSIGFFSPPSLDLTKLNRLLPFLKDNILSLDSKAIDGLIIKINQMPLACDKSGMTYYLQQKMAGAMAHSCLETFKTTLA